MILPMDQLTEYRSRDHKETEIDRLLAQLDEATDPPMQRLPFMQRLRLSFFERLGDWAREKQVERFISRDEKFKAVESKLSPYLTDVERKPVFRYLRTLIILDQLHDSLNHLGLKLPDEVKALDVGTGNRWFYAGALHNFLRSYGTDIPRTIALDGIEPKLTSKDIRRIKREASETNPMPGDVLGMNHDNHYDFIFMHRMLTSPGHFRKFGLEPTDLHNLMDKCSKMLKPNGIQVVISPQSAGEYFKLTERIPSERKLAEFNYKVELGNDNLNQMFTSGLFRVYSDGICIAKK